MLLLQRFYDIQGGRILVDAHDIAHATQESLRAGIAVGPARHFTVSPIDP